MTKPDTTWRNAQLPPKTAVFVIGDVHAQDTLLKPLLAGIEAKIAALPRDVTAHVIFIGDYVDRGRSAPDTIDMLLDFEKRMQENPNVKTTFLCGNHEDYLTRLLQAREIIDEPIGNPNDPNDLTYVLSYKNGAMNLRGLEDTAFTSGVLGTIQDYVRKYCPDIEIDPSLFDFDHKRFNRNDPDFLAKVNKLIKQFQTAVPQEHKEFYKRVFNNHHIIVGDYLFTHAGVDPSKTLEAQGIDSTQTLKAQPVMPGPPELEGKRHLESVMIRNPFLWFGDDPQKQDREDLPYCPFIVVHGHTPSVIKGRNRDFDDVNVLADGQKNYRLCIDTDVYNMQEGGLTCFMRYGDNAGFMAVHNSNPDRLMEYTIPQTGQWVARWMHTQKFKQYHPHDALSL